MKKLLSEYVNKPFKLFCDFLIANNTFSNNLKYPHARKLRITPGARSGLQGNSDFMNKIEAMV